MADESFCLDLTRGDEFDCCWVATSRVACCTLDGESFDECCCDWKFYILSMQSARSFLSYEGQSVRALTSGPRPT
jgi:hypothetical protein